MPDRFPSPLFNFWLRLHLRYAEKVIAVSNSVLKQLPVHPKLILIYNELPVQEQYPDFVKATSISPAFTFLYLSNFIKGKGQEYALEAFAKTHSKLPHWKLKFVGGDMGLKKNKEFRRKLQDQAERLGISEKVEWLGFTETVELEYRKADIVLNFSESESFSITCLEALFFGRPVIATDCGGPAEIIEPYKTGIIVRNKNVEEMAKAMMQLGSDVNKIKSMGEEAKTVVRKKFSVEKTSFLLKEVYQAAISN